MSVVETLTKARDLIARPGGWTQGTFARNSKGFATRSRGADAVCWCMRGALAIADVGYFGEHFVFKAIQQNAISAWNDAPDRTQDEVVAAFDRAIVLAKEEC